MTAPTVRRHTAGARWEGGGTTMTPGTDERPQMSVEDFEELARVAPESHA